MVTYFTVFAVAKNNAGKYLLLQRAAHRSNPGKWNFVTGFVQERESAEEAALRELEEETGMKGKVVSTSEPFWEDSPRARWVVVASLIEVENEEELKVDTQESQDFRWIDVNDMLVDEVHEIKVGFEKLGLLE